MLHSVTLIEVEYCKLTILDCLKTIPYLKHKYCWSNTKGKITRGFKAKVEEFIKNSCKNSCKSYNK
jgi:hypothetical protein